MGLFYIYDNVNFLVFYLEYLYLECIFSEKNLGAK